MAAWKNRLRPVKLAGSGGQVMEELEQGPHHLPGDFSSLPRQQGDIQILPAGWWLLEGSPIISFATTVFANHCGSGTWVFMQVVQPVLLILNIQHKHHHCHLWKRLIAGFLGVLPFILHFFLLLFFKYSIVISSITLAHMESFWGIEPKRDE